MDPENRVIPAEKRIPEAVLAPVRWNVGRVASATAWSNWYRVAVAQSFFILSLLPERPWAPYAPRIRVRFSRAYERGRVR